MKNAKASKSWGCCMLCALVRHLTWKCSIPVTFLTATAGVSIIQTRETRERAQYGLSLLINSERNLCSIRGNKTHLHESELCLFSLLCSLTPGRQSQSSYLKEINCSMIKMFSAGLVIPFIWYSSGNYVAGSGFGLCSKVHVLLMRTHNTQHTAVFSLYLKVFKVLPSWGFALGIVPLCIWKPLQLPVSGIWTGIMLLIPSRASLDSRWSEVRAVTTLAQGNLKTSNKN